MPYLTRPAYASHNAHFERGQPQTVTVVTCAPPMHRPMSVTAEKKRFAAKVVRRLRRDYPEAKCALRFDTPLELLIATILSAQCTDERVNQVTRQLFQRTATAADFAHLPIEKLEKAIQSTGFFRNKAKNIKECCTQIAEQYDGEVPRDLEALVALPGVGRKTANVVLGTAFGLATGVVVDTHVARISHRLGLTQQSDPEKIERELTEQLPQSEWVDFSHRMIHHGRTICKARQPLCDRCGMNDICPRLGVAGQVNQPSRASGRFGRQKRGRAPGG
jgi:endonuclease-3